MLSKACLVEYFFSKSKLEVVYDFVVFQELFYSIVHDTFKDLTEIGQKGYWSVVNTFSFISFFKEGTN